jgi:hypothetical protein
MRRDESGRFQRRENIRVDGLRRTKIARGSVEAFDLHPLRLLCKLIVHFGSRFQVRQI